MNKLKSLILGALAVAGACVVQAESVSYLDPVFDAKGAVTGYTTKYAECTEINWGYNPASGGIIGSGSMTLSAGWYVVSGNYQISSTLTVSGDVKLILRNGVKFEVNYDGKSRGGLRVEEGSSLTIYAQSTEDSKGWLIAYGGTSAAGIGSGSKTKANCGKITINGGYIEATGGGNAAGIGSGAEGACTQGITINGGVVTATGGGDGAGIGSGDGGNAAGIGRAYFNASGITINGGTVNATGGSSGAAGIGGGQQSGAKDITINGGTVTAVASTSGAGIGGGKYGACNNIAINGGTVTATGGKHAPGIGSGYMNPDSISSGVTINGGTVTATGGERGSGIGGAETSTSCPVTINGGRVIAKGVAEGKDASGAGVGGGFNCHGNDITINGGEVTATAGGGAAGIGGGCPMNGGSCSGNNIKINGGTVTATGGESAAGIGGGMFGSGNGIKIAGGTVYAQGGIKGGAGIGGGADGSADDLTISGGYVQAIAGGSILPDDEAHASDYTSSWSNGTITRGMDIGSGGKINFNFKGFVKKAVKLIPDVGKALSAEIGIMTKTSEKLNDEILTGISAKDLKITGGTVEALMIGGCNGDTTASVTITGGSVHALAFSDNPVDANGRNVDLVVFTDATTSPADLEFLGEPKYNTENLYPNTANPEHPRRLFLWPIVDTTTQSSGKSTYQHEREIVLDGDNRLMKITGSKLWAANSVTNRVVSYTLSSGVKVNGEWVDNGKSGAGWSCANNVLSLSEAKAYTLTGSDTSGKLRVDVKAKANVTLDNLTLPLNKENEGCINFYETSNGSTLTLKGENKVYGLSNAIWIESGATLTVQEADSTGCLVGSGDASTGKRCIHNDGTLILSSGTIKNYKPDWYGGCIYSKGTFTMNGGTISGCSASGNNGGAVYNDGTFTMEGGVISGCSASGNNGGAVYNDGTFTMNGGTISGCSANYGGGVAFISGTGALNGGTISGCSATYGSGFAVLGGWGSSDVKVDVHGGMVIKDNSNLGHSPVFLEGGSLNVWGGTFTGNSSSQGYGVLTRWAGNGFLNVYGGVITCNSIKPVDGASVYGLVSDKLPDGVVNGYAVTQIGKNYVVGQNVTSRNDQLTGGTFTFNPTVSEYTAAGVKLASGCSVVEHTETTPKTYVINVDAEFRVNGALLSTGSGTGWTFNAGTGLLTLNSAMDYALSGYCNAGLNVDVTANATVSLTNVQIHAGNLGRVIFNVTAANATFVLTGANQVYTTDDNAAICVAKSAKLTVTGDGELVGGAGVGGRAFTVNGELVIESGTIRNYHTTATGGAVYNNGTFTMNGGTISYCQANSDGGAVRNNYHFTMNGGTISYCSSQRNGGGVINDSASFTMNGGTISRCSAWDSGGAICNHGTAVDINGGTISACTANGDDGGAISNNDESRLTVFGGTFKDNTAGRGQLGGCFACDRDSSIILYGGSYSGNAAGKGCQLYSGKKANGSLFGGVFDVDPTSSKASDKHLVLQDGASVTQVGNNYVVGQNVTQANSQLTGGTYTFNPTNTEYQAADVKVMGNCSVTPHTETTPKTYVVAVAAEFRVNGALLSTGSGSGWTFDADAGLLTLSSAMEYALSGYCDVGLKVDVTANATVALTDVRIRAGNLGSEIFNVTGADVRFSLGGTNEIYTTDGHAAIGVANGAKLTIDGDGALVGGKAAPNNSRCVTVAAGGALVVSGGTIKDYYTTDNGAAVCNSGTTSIFGGTFTGNSASAGVLARNSGSLNVYGGVFSGNSNKPTDQCAVSGGVYDVQPEGVVSGSAATQVGDNYIVGENVTQENNALTGGTYTFDPGSDFYAAAGVKLDAVCLVRAQGTMPVETYAIVKEAEFKVNGALLREKSGPGWTFNEETNLLTLASATNYTLTGYSDLAFQIDVLSNATVTLDGISIHAGKIGRSIINVSAENAMFVLAGTNEVYATDGSAAVCVSGGAKLTVMGDGSLVGGKARSANGRGFKVATDGTLVVESGTIRDYYTTAEGGAVYSSGTVTMNGGAISGCRATGDGGGIRNAGTLTIFGGVIEDCYSDNWGGAIANAENCITYIYGGSFKGNGAQVGCPFLDGFGSQVAGYLYGGVWDVNPLTGNDTTTKDGAAVTKVGANDIVGKNVTQMNNALTGGTYTFNPTDADYAAAGVKLDAVCEVRTVGTTPETYVVYKEAEFKVNGVLLRECPGGDWTFDAEANRLTLAAPTNFTLTGYSDLALQIDVLSNATVALDGVGIRAGAIGRSIFQVSAEDATFVLKGTNEVYATDGSAAVYVGACAKLTVTGDGELAGGRAAGANGRGFTVYGTLVVESGTIRDFSAADNAGSVYNAGTFTMNGGAISGCKSGSYGGGIYIANGTGELNGGTISGCSATYGGALVLWNSGTVTIRSGMTICGNSAVSHGAVFLQGGTINVWGGTFRNNSVGTGVLVDWIGTLNVYGGVFVGNSVKPVFRRDDWAVAVSGGVYDVAPEYVVSGSAATQVGDLYVVGTNVTQKDGVLTGGTYTFNPTDDLYVEAGVAIAAEYVVLAQATDPVTYTIDWNWTDFLVDGTDIVIGSGDGWSYDKTTGRLTLDAAKTYVLSGSLTRKDLELGVTVDAAGATVVLSNATITSSERAPIAVNAAGVTVQLKGNNRLEVAALGGASALPVASALPAMAVADDASVMIARGGAAGETAKLYAVGGAKAVAIGGEGDVTIASGTVEAQGGIVGANVTISGGTVSAAGRDGAVDVGGTDVRITGGSVVASKVTDPKNADGASVWCVTVSDVVSRGPVAVTNVAYLADSYGQDDLYPVAGALCLWLPNGTYNGYYVGDDPIPYYATVASGPTVAIRKILALYVNDELVTAPDHAEGWTYADGVLTLEGSTNYVVTGESMTGDVRIVVADSCDLALSGVRLGMGDTAMDYNLLWIDKGVLNMMIDGATAFQVNGDKKPIGVNAGATLNIRGSGTAFAWGVDVVGNGRVTMEDPTSVTFTTQEAAESAAAVVKPVADENEFPGINQEAYGERFVVSAVQSGPGTWTLDYQISEATSNELQATISSVETLTNLVEAIVGGTPTVTITPIPGFYYGMAGTTEVTEMDSDATLPPAWYAGQEGKDLKVSGTTFQDAVKAFYQLRATAKP